MLRHAAGGWATAVGAHHGGRAPPRGTGQLTAQRAGAVSAFLSVKPGGFFRYLVISQTLQVWREARRGSRARRREWTSAPPLSSRSQRPSSCSCQRASQRWRAQMQNRMTPRRCASRGAAALYRHTHTAPPFATQGCVQLADLAFRKTQFDLAFALARAGEPSACRDSLVIVSPTPAWCDGRSAKARHEQ